MVLITSDEIRDILPSGFKQICDKLYQLPTDEEVMKEVKDYLLFKKGRDKVRLAEDMLRSERRIRPEFEDCDNRALEMVAYMSGYGWPFAMAFIPGHCVCLYINDKKELKYIEPLDGAVIDQKITLLNTLMV